MAATTPTDAVIDFAAMLAVAARHALLVSPNLQSLRLVGVGPDGELSIPIPLPNAAEDMEERILAVLGTLPKGERMAGKKLAEECETSQNNGHYCRIVARLKKAGKIDVHQLYGYKLA